MLRTLRFCQFSCALILAVAATACQQQSGSTPASSKSKKEVKETANHSATAEAIVTVLNDVEAGQSKPDQFTLEFRKTIAEPITDDDRKLGYSAQEWDRYTGSLKGLNVN